MTKVFILVVTAQEKDYCFDLFSKQLKSLTYPKKEILFIDNSKNDTYYKKIDSINSSHNKKIVKDKLYKKLVEKNGNKIRNKI